MADDPGPERPTGHAPASWRARPVAGIALRVGALLVPALAAGAAAYAAGRAAPPPSGPSVVLWWLSLLGLATIVGMLVERVAKRVLPLAALLELSLAFPDRAPSRFAIARSAGNVRNLERRIAEAKRDGVDDDPTRAAEQILELVAALSAHDRKTRGHSERVRAFTDMIASELPVPQGDRDRLRWAALLHDVGKLRVPPKILNKPGKPDPHEWERLKEHPDAGARLAAPLLSWLGAWAGTIAEHHERFDGRGYPRGLAGEDISLGARIVSVADSFEVMTAARAYKRPMSVAAARRELAACASAQFDPVVVRAFLNISLGRLWLTVGPASWIAAAPVLGSLQRATSQVVIAAKAATVATAFGIAGTATQPSLAAGTNGTPQRAEATAPSIGGTVAPTLDDREASTGTEPTSGDRRPRERDRSGGGSGDDSGGSGGGSSDPGDGGGDDGSNDLIDVDGTAGGAVDDVTDAVDEVANTVEDVTDGGEDLLEDITDGGEDEGDD